MWLPSVVIQLFHNNNIIVIRPGLIPPPVHDSEFHNTCINEPTVVCDFLSLDDMVHIIYVSGASVSNTVIISLMLFLRGFFFFFLNPELYYVHVQYDIEN